MSMSCSIAMSCNIKQILEEIYVSDDDVTGIVSNPVRCRSIKAYKITVIERKNISYEAWINGKEPNYVRWTEYYIEETEFGEVMIYNIRLQ